MKLPQDGFGQTFVSNGSGGITMFWVCDTCRCVLMWGRDHDLEAHRAWHQTPR